jgi:hypothetical protein
MTDPVVPKTPPDEGGETRFDLSTMREVEPGLHEHLGLYYIDGDSEGFLATDDTWAKAQAAVLRRGRAMARAHAAAESTVIAGNVDEMLSDRVRLQRENAREYGTLEEWDYGAWRTRSHGPRVFYGPNAERKAARDRRRGDR